MDVHTSAPRSRRAILGAALGGAGALVAHALGRPGPATAATGDPLVMGQLNTATNITQVQAATDPVIVADATGANRALKAQSLSGMGVHATTANSGDVHFTAVVAHTGDVTNIAPDTSFTGVYGFSEDPDNFTAAGVWGDSLTGTGVVGTGYIGVYGTGVVGSMGDVDAASTGIYGFAGDESAVQPTAGAGVVGRAGVGATYGVVAAAAGATQYGLYVAGRLRLSRSAKTAFSSTATSKKITLAGVTSSSFVIATLQTSISGCYVRAVVCGTGYFYIYLSKAPGKTAYVGYVVVN